MFSHYCQRSIWLWILELSVKPAPKNAVSSIPSTQAFWLHWKIMANKLSS